MICIRIFELTPDNKLIWKYKNIYKSIRGIKNMKEITELIGRNDLLIKKSNIVFRRIHGSFFLIDIADKFSTDRCTLFEINEIGSFLWNEISDDVTPEALTCKLLGAIVDAIDYNVLYQDVNEFLLSLLQKNFIEVRKNG